jgi:hypothetical protein
MMRTLQEVHEMYKEVTLRVQQTQERVQELERKYSMGLVTEQTLAQTTEFLAAQTGQQHALAWVIWNEPKAQ